MTSEPNPVPLSWYQRRKYSGKFIAYTENEIIASGRSYSDCRHKARERIAEKKIQDKIRNVNLKYYYVERKNRIYRGLIIVLLSLLLFEKLLVDLVFADEILLYKKIEIFVFYNLVLLSIFLTSLMIINPVVRTQSVFGLLGKAIVNKERHLGHEVTLIGIAVFIFLGSIVLVVTSNIEFGISLDSTIVLLIGFLLALQSWFTIIEEKELKRLHYYLIDQITLEDRLSYEEIATYLSEIPQIKEKGLSNSKSILMTIEASLESPLSLTRVIAFHILFRDLGIMVGSIFVSFAIGYLLFFQGIVTNLFGTRIFASFLSAGLLLFYALVKNSTTNLFAESFVKQNPHFTLRPGGVDRIYMKFFPEDVKQIKNETISTILTQSVRLTAGLGLFFLLYGTELILMLAYIDDYTIIEYLNSITLALGVLPIMIFILLVARRGTRKWVETVEFEMLDLDKKLESQIGMTPNEILSYLQEAQNKYKEVFIK